MTRRFAAALVPAFVAVAAYGTGHKFVQIDGAERRVRARSGGGADGVLRRVGGGR
jgi:hypothetical protein